MNLVREKLSTSEHAKDPGEYVRCARELHQSAGKLKPLEAVSCTGVLLNRETHSHCCGQDEPGEGVCVTGPLLGGKSEFRRWASWLGLVSACLTFQLRGVPPASNRLDGRP